MAHDYGQGLGEGEGEGCRERLGLLDSTTQEGVAAGSSFQGASM